MKYLAFFLSGLFFLLVSNLKAESNGSTDLKRPVLNSGYRIDFPNAGVEGLHGDFKTHAYYKCSLKNTLKVLTPSLAIHTHPASLNNVCVGDSVQFTVTGLDITSYQWQCSTDGGVTFTDLSDGTTYTGSQTSILNVKVIAAMDSIVFRCVVSDGSITLNSNAALMLLDTQAPSFNCPASIFVSTDSGQCSAVVNYPVPIANDNCIMRTVDYTILMNTEGAGTYSGNYTLGYSFTPDTDITVTAFHRYFGSKYSIWAEDGTLLYTQATPGPDNTWVVVPLSSTLHLAAGQTYRVGAYTNNASYRWSNSGVNSFPDGTINYDCFGVGDTIPSTSNGTWWLVDLIYTKTYTDAPGLQIAGLPSGSAFPTGTTTNVFVIGDLMGNQDTCSFDVTVTDTEPPSYNSMADMQINSASGECNALVTYSLPTATDNCDYLSSATILGNAIPTELSSGDITIGYSFTPNKNITVTGFKKYTGSKISIWTEDGILLGSQGVFTSWTLWAVFDLSTPIELQGGETYRIAVYTGTANSSWYFWQTSFGTSFADGTINQSYHGVGDVFPTVVDGAQWYLVDMVYTKGISGVQTAGLPPGSIFPVGTTTNVFVATDNVGNTDTCRFNVVVNGINPPVLTCPSNINQTADVGLCGAVVSIINPVATDVCGEAIIINGFRSDSLLLTDLYPVGITTITWIATDASGNASTCVQTITITDNEFPIILCPGNIVADIDSGHCTAVVNYNVIATDACDGVAASNIIGDVSPAGFAYGNFTMGYSFTPTSNIILKGFRKFFGTKVSLWKNDGTLILSDTSSPGAGGWQDILLSSPINLNAGETYRIGAFSGSSAYSLYFWSSSSDSSFADGVINQDYFYPGDTFPTMSNGVRYWLIDLIYTKISGPWQTAGLPSGASFPVGTTTNTFIASDMAGNTVSCSFDVTVVDTVSPVMNCPNDITVNNDTGQCYAMVAFPAITPTDNDTLSTREYNITGELSSPSQYPLDRTVGYSFTPNTDITVTAFKRYFGTKVSLWTDDGILLGSATTSGPNGIWSELELASPIQLSAGQTYRLGAYSNYSDYFFNYVLLPEFNDGVIGQGCYGIGDDFPGAPVDGYRYFVDLVYTAKIHFKQIVGLPSGSSFPVGTTSNVYVATDNSGNTDTCSFNINVVDAEPEIKSCPHDTVVSGLEGECSSVVTFIHPTTIDNCIEKNFSNILGGVVHNYSTNTSDQTMGLAFTPDKDITVTAFRRYFGSRISLWTDTGTLLYSDTVSGIDGTWTEKPLQQPVYLLSGQTYIIGTYIYQPYLYCIAGFSFSDFADGTIVAGYSGEGDSIPTQMNNYTIYLVDLTYIITNPKQVAGLPSGSVFPAGTTTNVFVTTYLTGDTDTCSFDVTVNADENIPPVINCPADQTVYISGSDVSYTVQGAEFDPVSVYDNCGISGISNSYNSLESLSGAMLPIGTTTIYWSVNDFSGNDSVCSFDVNVISTAGMLDLKGNSISIYPNPATNECFISTPGERITKIKMTDLTGKTIIEENDLLSEVTIDLSGLSKGMYLLYVQTDHFIFTEKLIKN